MLVNEYFLATVLDMLDSFLSKELSSHVSFKDHLCTRCQVYKVKEP